MLSCEINAPEWLAEYFANRKPLPGTVKCVSALRDRISLPRLLLYGQDSDRFLGENPFNVCMNPSFQILYQGSIQVVRFVTDGIAAKNAFLSGLTQRRVKQEVRRGIRK